MRAPAASHSLSEVDADEKQLDPVDMSQDSARDTGTVVEFEESVKEQPQPHQEQHPQPQEEEHPEPQQEGQPHPQEEEEEQPQLQEEGQPQQQQEEA